jgi:hypothetical protein
VTEADGHLGQAIQIPVDWSDAAGTSVIYINQFVAQLGPPTRSGTPDGIYLLLGSVSPPLIVGDDDEARRPYIEAAMAGIKPEVHGQFYLSRERLDELIHALHTIAENFDATVKNAESRAEATE